MRGLVLWATLAILAPVAAAAQAPPASVSTDLVVIRELTETAPILSQIVAGRDSAVATRVAGVVAEVPVRVGDRVVAGEEMVVLDRELLQIDLEGALAAEAEAEAGLEAAEARLIVAQRGFERADALRGSAAFSQGIAEDREGVLAEAIGLRAQSAARILAARAALSRARYNLERASIEAPFDGVVLEVSAEEGEYIQAGTQLVRLLDFDSLEVEANVPARYIAGLSEGQKVKAYTEEGDEIDLTIRAFLPIEFSSTRTRPVRFAGDLSGSSSPRAVGQTISVEVPVGAARDVVSVPKDALIQGPGGWQVFVHEDGKAVPRPVEIGAPLGDRFEVLTGLEDGDEVVVRGNERLRPMQEIAPMRVNADEGGQDATSVAAVPAERHVP